VRFGVRKLGRAAKRRHSLAHDASRGFIAAKGMESQSDGTASPRVRMERVTMELEWLNADGLGLLAAFSASFLRQFSSDV
jgi:hypothetical protein